MEAKTFFKFYLESLSIQVCGYICSLDIPNVTKKAMYAYDATLLPSYSEMSLEDQITFVTIVNTIVF